MGSVVKGSFANDVCNQSEQRKLNLTNFILILLDRITFKTQQADDTSWQVGKIKFKIGLEKFALIFFQLQLSQ